MHEPRRPAGTSAERVQRLGDRHSLALARTLKRWKIPHARGTSPLVTVPFLLAAYYLARMLDQLARAGGPTPAFFDIRYEGQEALEKRWGSGAFGVELFTNLKDRKAWWGNCALAAGLVPVLPPVRQADPTPAAGPESMLGQVPVGIVGGWSPARRCRPPRWSSPPPGPGR
jgi:hypothetical protein